MSVSTYEEHGRFGGLEFVGAEVESTSGAVAKIDWRSNTRSVFWRAWQIPWQYTMLGFVSVDFDSIGQANFEIVISCSDRQAAAGRKIGGAAMIDRRSWDLDVPPHRSIGHLKS
ncbi:MAG TPA: hypothetical protein VLE19_02135 [Pyrinomonadaceae bacterium]|nr:hypothetical protein [Pyrinomonadaceae bacterium]